MSINKISVPPFAFTKTMDKDLSRRGFNKIQILTIQIDPLSSGGSLININNNNNDETRLWLGQGIINLSML